MKFSNTHWALALILTGAVFATPALAGAGKGYGTRLLSKSENKQVAATEDVRCSMGDHHAHGKDASDHKHTHAKGR
ncbi:hypothetical protein A7E78_04620 [Syntrophotalea acetylenivorans]|uniref:Uncharacterized protein n=1 Tax=Syntrophotalea acetylenivorans TaxID=1842532 RepID=A0A1L3GML6_9BACT|nr:hypothetical protein [Syntrophotalea acetylenivorans]APG27179.1 hypothetical protein A7E78_04620 [Syntrophotalea acetylenivorans]